MATQIRSEYWATATQIRSEYWATVFLLAVGCGANASPDASEGDLNVSTAKSAAQALSELCPSTGTPTPIGAVIGRQLSEVSGLVASLTNPGLFYVHNDSGGSASIHAIDDTGSLIANISVSGVTAKDWEDIARGPGPEAGTSYLYVGDVGDNAMRRTEIRVYRIVEPQLDAAKPEQTVTVAADTIRLRYPDGAHNAETLLVDPVTGTLYVITKSADGTSGVYALYAPFTVGAAQTLQLERTLSFGSGALAGSPLVTGGDVAVDGRAVLLRTYDGAFLWPRTETATLAEAFDNGSPCHTPAANEPQGEAIAFGAANDCYYTLSEGTGQPLYRVSLAW